jgi:peptide/nickel transport system permease protein
MRHYRHFLSHWQNWLALILVLSFTFASIFPALLSPNDPDNPGPFKRVGKGSDLVPRPPSENAPLGTMPRQLSVYHSLIWGARDAMRFGLLVAFSVACIGIVFGAVAGYAGGVVNRTMMRVADAFLTFPIIAAVALLTQLRVSTIYSLGGQDLVLLVQRGVPITSQSLILALLQRIDPLTFSLILFSWMPYARLVNTLVIELKQTEFIVAARSIGARPARILFRHILPNAITPAVVLFARDIGSFVLLQATFTFIGLGGGSIWGYILVNGRDWVIGLGGNVMAYWWVFLPATLAVILFGITWNLLGDGLSELLDPHNG